MNILKKKRPYLQLHIRYHSDPNLYFSGYLVNVEDIGFLEVLPVSRGDNQ